MHGVNQRRKAALVQVRNQHDSVLVAQRKVYHGDIRPLVLDAGQCLGTAACFTAHRYGFRLQQQPQSLTDRGVVVHDKYLNCLGTLL